MITRGLCECHTHLETPTPLSDHISYSCPQHPDTMVHIPVNDANNKKKVYILQLKNDCLLYLSHRIYTQYIVSIHTVFIMDNIKSLFCIITIIWLNSILKNPFLCFTKLLSYTRDSVRRRRTWFFEVHHVVWGMFNLVSYMFTWVSLAGNALYSVLGSHY